MPGAADPHPVAAMTETRLWFAHSINVPFS